MRPVQDIASCRRIAIVGNNGSGKSFLARQLGQITGLPVVHLDMEYWRPGWQEPAPEEWSARHAQLVAEPQWILDGNHTSTMELRFAAADLVLFLKVNRLVCLCGVLGRQGKTRPDTPAYLTDKYDKRFLRLLWGLWRFNKTRRYSMHALCLRYPSTPFYTIKGRRHMRRLLREWRQDTVAP